MSTFKKLRLIIRYQDEIIAQSWRCIEGHAVDSDRITELARRIAGLRATLRD